MSSAFTPPWQKHRIDHQGYVPEIWAGLLLTSIYLIQTDPLMDYIGNRLEFVLDLMLAAGSGICLFAACLGTRWFFPCTPKRIPYTLHMVGLPLIIITLAAYTFASSLNPNLVLVTLGGALGLCLEIASVRMVIEISGELKEGSP